LLSGFNPAPVGTGVAVQSTATFVSVLYTGGMWVAYLYTYVTYVLIYERGVKWMLLYLFTKLEWLVTMRICLYQVYDGATTSGLRLHPNNGFTFNASPRITLTASSGEMLIRFITDALHNSRGWKATFSAGKICSNSIICTVRSLNIVCLRTF